MVAPFVWVLPVCTHRYTTFRTGVILNSSTGWTGRQLHEYKSNTIHIQELLAGQGAYSQTAVIGR
eukprot:6679734-Pyramimonas_sp.AAC.2